MRGIFQAKFKKVMLIAVTVFFVLSNFYFLALYNVKPVKAVDAVIDAPLAAINLGWKGLDVFQFSQEEIINDLKATFFKNVVANLARQFAKGFAQYIVTGSKGGKPFWETDLWGSIVDQGQAAFEDWLTGAISAGIGLDICEFDPQLTLNIALTLPNKPDKLKPATIMGEKPPKGCSFKDLKDKYSMEGAEWQDFLKLKVTDIGPDFRKTVDQVIRDIEQNKNLHQESTGFTDWSDEGLSVIADLNSNANKLKRMSQELDDDISKMVAYRGKNEPVQLSVGTGPFIIAPEYINDIKSLWQQKISAGRSEASSKKSTYRSCASKELVAIRLDPCDTILQELGYNSMPSNQWLNQDATRAGVFLREVQSKLTTVYNLYNSLSTGYESMSKFINNQIDPEMYETGSLYNRTSAQTQFEPQADSALEAHTQIDEGTTGAKEEAEAKEEHEQDINEGWQASVEKISDYIKTPAKLLQARSIEAVAADSSSTAGDYTKSIIADSLGIFLQELYNLYIQQLLEALSNPKKQKEKKKGGNIFSAEEQSIVTGEGVNLYFESLDQGMNSNLPDLDLLQEFQTMISGKKINPNIYNNVIDLNFALAIERRLTIAEAMTKGNLRGTYSFAYGEDLQSNTYHLANIKKLRKARVVPLGLELAAELIRDCNYRKDHDPCPGLGYSNCTGMIAYCDWTEATKTCTKKGSVTFGDFQDLTDTNSNILGTPLAIQRFENCKFDATNVDLNKKMYNQVINATLSDVVKGFDERGQNGECGDYDAQDQESPFCNLVDPDWILKIPATKCLQPEAFDKNEAYGELLQNNDSGRRYARCADFASCLQNDEPKNCGSGSTGSYGVCVKEKNVWRISSAISVCDAYNDSCRAYTFTDREGKENEIAYLKNTLDPANCSADTVGCKGFTRVYDGQKFYFNRNVQTCEAQAEGCHEFIADPTIIENYPVLPTIYDDNVLATRVYYKINPYCAFYGNDPMCANFMTQCSDSEVGCAAYQPVSGDPTVTAVLQPEDLCPAECNGFSAYYRQPTNFDPLPDLAYFVPNTATSCEACNASCSEFTNLEGCICDDGTRSPSCCGPAEDIEYYTRLRQCIKPGSDLGEKSFITWQSIADGPQQVITHELKSIIVDDLPDYDEYGTAGEVGAPATYDFSGDCRLDPTIGSFCIKFYDFDENIYYRDIRKTILVSDEFCYALRKTDSTASACEATSGTWEDGNCIYMAYVPEAENDSCKRGVNPYISQTCAKEKNKCSNYLGASGHNIYTVFYDNFEPGLEFPASYSTDGISISSESLSDSGHSLMINRLSAARKSVSISGGYFYVLEFIVKGEGLFNIPGFGEITLTDPAEWRAFSLGPVRQDSSLESIYFDNSLNNYAIYIDNVNLTQHKASYYLIQNSWANVGCSIEDLSCEAYNGPHVQTFYIKQFSQICAEEKVGCQFLIDTQNSLNPQSQIFNEIIVPADNKVAYVVNDAFKCEVESKGCEKFSEPTLQAGTGVVYDNVILKNDPEAYSGPRSILCNEDTENCTELINDNGYPEYYKIDPTRICILDNRVLSATGNPVLGWYLSGVTETIGCNAINYNNEIGCTANSGDWDPVTETCSVTISDKPAACAAVGNGGTWLSDLNQCAKPLTAANESACLAQKGLWTSGSSCVLDPMGVAKVLDGPPMYDGNTAECDMAQARCTGFQTINQNVQPNTTITIDTNCLLQSNNAWLSNQCYENYYGQTYFLIDDGENINRQGCASIGTDWSKGCVAFRNTVANEVQVLKVQKDRDCAEWIACEKTDSAGNCTQINVKYFDNAGLIQTSKTITPANIDVATNKDGVRYNTSGSSPKIINRNSYITRFTNVNDKWDAGDFSGYTIPNRFPVEVEIRDEVVDNGGIITPVYNFSKYPQDNNSFNDERYTKPVCKIFPEEDSPLPHDLSTKSTYTKLPNLYSQSVGVFQIADACNYEQVEASGVTTNFPFGYLSEIMRDSNARPQICTSNKNLNGKICSGNVANNPLCSSLVDPSNTAAGSVAGECTGIETIKTNFGLQNRCLESDTLNPLYGGIFGEGVYACLSYFPFKYNECGHLSSEGECLKLPYCSWVGGGCTYDICDFHKDQASCEIDQESDGSPNCIWDGGSNICLYRKCSKTPNLSQSTCVSLAPYCAWYGDRCTEDICQQSYSKLPGGGLDSHGIYGEICMNAKGAYCDWEMAGPSAKNRYTWYCQLQCEKKYPFDSPAYQNACNADGFCTWYNSSCTDICEMTCPADADASECASLCSPAKCDWVPANRTCVSKCNSLATIGPDPDFDDFDESACGLNSDCRLDPADSAYTCVDACTGKSQSQCEDTSIGNGKPSEPACVWNGSVCTDACQVKIDETSCIAGYLASKCSWNGAACVKNPSCTGTGNQTCAETWSCEIDYPKCTVQDFGCSSIPATEGTGTTPGDTCNKTTSGNCEWKGGGCHSQIDSGDCEYFDEVPGCANPTDAFSCKWMAYTWHQQTQFCMPTWFSPWCHMCQVPVYGTYPNLTAGVCYGGKCH